MKMLIVTQKADRNDPILGFFHEWIRTFSSHADAVTVIAQSAGRNELPPNVSIVSLGKEKGKGPLMQVLRFLKLQWTLRNTYDVVLVHMTPVWVVIGAVSWMLLRKPVYLWYEARGARWPLRVALRIVRNVFSASAYGMPVSTPKSIVTGHGIDVARFSPDASNRVSGRLISVGRVTAAKHPEVVIRAMADLPDCALTWVGSPVTEADQVLCRSLNVGKNVTFVSVTQEKLPRLLQQSDIFLHAATTGLDKAVLEAMACGCIVISTSQACAGVLPSRLLCTPDTLSDRVKEVLALPTEEREALRKELRETVVRYHNLERLVPTLLSYMQTPSGA